MAIMLTRRQMLSRSLLFSVAPVVPGFLARTARAAEAERDRRVLVVIQLDGGNDGLNTVVPYQDENYAKLRPKLHLTEERLVRLNDELALHISLKPVAELIEAGQLSIVQGVGYPNPNRSHFESMSIWHSAQLTEAEQGQYGWLGRALDARAQQAAGPHAVYASANSVPVALWGRRSATAVIRSPEELRLDAPLGLLHAAAHGSDGGSPLAQSLAASCDDAFSTCETLVPLLAAAPTDGVSGSLGVSLQTIAALIKSDSPARVYYATQGGYDTHSAQRYEHAGLLRTLGRELSAFLNDMKASRLEDRVAVLVFSEFGRRAAENGSEGTDHGAAAPLFVAGAKLTTAIHGPTPNLGDLEDGDVRMAIDFRRVYATLLDHWLEIPSATVLGGVYEPLDLFEA
jgi:uncharacterized protein (DUF1501 family)